MASYLTQLPAGNSTPFPSPTVKPPSELNWIPNASHCSVVLQLTNVTNRDIQIDGLDLRLAAQPVPVSSPSGPDSLVDICTVLGLRECGPIGIGPGYSVYDAQIDLSGGGVGSTFPATLSVSPFADHTLYTLPFILAPGAENTRDIALTITVPNGTALAYQVVPELVVLGSSGATSTYSFPTLKSNLVFAQLPAAVHEWKCYGLLVDSGRVVPDSQVNYAGGAFGDAVRSICI
jgi:hypothetical protein